MPSGALQSRLRPPTAPMERNFSDASVTTSNPKALDSTATDLPNFQEIIRNSNTDQSRARLAQKNGDEKGTKTNEQFEKAMRDKLNRENTRLPSNALDKDAFLKLFITQIQSQDPLDPQESTEMASQLAQFHSLEQMLNVNKNLEKMTSEQATDRSVSLINFVGKDIKISGGKLRYENGKITDATYSAERDIPNATLEIRDSSGTVVTTKEIGFLKKGENTFKFDDLADEGVLNNGIYTFSVIGKDVNGGDVPVKITSNVKVNGVDLLDSGGSFFTELGKVRIGEVDTVGTSSTTENIGQSRNQVSSSVNSDNSSTNRNNQHSRVNQTVPSVQDPADASDGPQSAQASATPISEDGANSNSPPNNPPTKATAKNPYTMSDSLSRPPDPFFARRI